MWVLVTIKILKKGATKERELKLARDVRDDASIGRTLHCQLLASSVITPTAHKGFKPRERVSHHFHICM